MADKPYIIPSGSAVPGLAPVLRIIFPVLPAVLALALSCASEVVPSRDFGVEVFADTAADIVDDVTDAAQADPGRDTIVNTDEGGDLPAVDTIQPDDGPSDVPAVDAADSAVDNGSDLPHDFGPDAGDPLADLCRSCTRDDQCGAPGNLCIQAAGYMGCSVDCSADEGICPDAFRCGQVVREGGNVHYQCVPTGEFVDDCGVCGGDGSTCADCEGVANGTAVVDGCGVCSGGTTGHVANSDKDCRGVCFGTAVIDCSGLCDGGAVVDECGKCNGDGKSCADCDGVPNGTAAVDDCGVCSGGTSGHTANIDKDCSGICYGLATPDDCDVCSGGTTGHTADSDKDCAGVCFGGAVVDCDGECGGGAVYDACGVCSGGSTGHVADSDMDCAGTCWGTAAPDGCGVCSGGESGHVADSDRDCAGVCFGGKTLDCLGVCGGTALIDCADVCRGTAFVDDCGVCSGGASGHAANIDKDCSGVCFGAAVRDCTGTCAGTAVRDGCAVCSGGTSGHVAESDRDCLGNCFGDAVVDCNGTCDGGAVVDRCGVCGGDGAGCADCMGVVDGDAFLDVCGVCSGGTSGHVANSDEDCHGVCFGTAVFDTCGVCSGGTTGHTAGSDMDCLGVCFGSAAYDCAGTCAGSAYPDHCGICDADAANDCVKDCAGVWGGAARLDSCGVCDSNPANDCVKDCTGIWGGAAYFDGCGICSGGMSGHTAESDRDCAGTCFGSAAVDHCGTCDAVPANDCIQDCVGVWGGVAAPDDCAVCSGGTSGHVANIDKDCAGACFGSALPDDCMVCSGGTSGHVAGTDKDCAGVCFGSTVVDCAGACGGTASVDGCGQCSGGTSGHLAESDRDCAGVCFGPAEEDCNGDCDGDAFIDDCGVCSGGFSGHAANADKDCLGECWGDAVQDCTDTCAGTAVIDDCDICSGGTSGHDANSDKDCAGTCFGHAEPDCAGVCDGGAYYDNCGVCDADATNDCNDDCAGVPGGSAFVDDCGICSGGTSGHLANSDMDECGECFGDGPSVWYEDADGDGFGDPASATSACDAPVGYVADALDCDDANRWISRAAIEIPSDGVDQDCDGGELCYVDADSDLTWNSGDVHVLGLSRSPDYHVNRAVQAMHLQYGNNLHQNEADFVAAYSSSSKWDLLVIDIGTTAPGANLRAAIADHIVTRGRPAIVTYDGLADDTAMQDVLGVTDVVVHSGCAVGVSGDGPTSLFAIMHILPPAPATGGTCRSMAAVDGGPGFVDVTSTSGAPSAVVWARGGKVLVSGVKIPDDKDFDSDGYEDGTELMANFIALQLSVIPRGGVTRGWLASSADTACTSAGLLPVALTGDCDDNPSSCGAACNVFMEEVCDGWNNDCDTKLDEVVWFGDADGDSFGVPDVKFTGCPQPAGYADNPDDCDDDAGSCGAACNPAAAEVCDGWDNDCNELVDIDDPGIDPGEIILMLLDGDHDGFGEDGLEFSVCPGTSGYSLAGGDCDDTRPLVNPDGTEVAGNNLDEDCDGQVACFNDADRDGFWPSHTAASPRILVLELSSGAAPNHMSFAAARMGLRYTRAFNEAAFLSAWGDGSQWDVLLVSVSTVSLVTEPIRAALSKHIVDNGRSAVVRVNALYQDASLMGILGVTFRGMLDGVIQPGPDMLMNPYDWVEDVPAPSSVITANAYNLAGEGLFAVQLLTVGGNGYGVELATHSGRVLAGDSLPASSNGDADGDGLVDIYEFYMNAIAYILGDMVPAGISGGWMAMTPGYFCSDGALLWADRGGDCDDGEDASHVGAPDVPDMGFVDSDCDGIDGVAAEGFFVSLSGVNGNPGSMTSPFASIKAGIAAAKASATKKNVYVAGYVDPASFYNEIVSLSDGVSLFGGYDPVTWARSTTLASRIWPTGEARAFTVTSYAGSGVVQNLSVQSAAPSGTGASSRAAVISNVSGNLLLESNVISAAAGAGGSSGMDGLDGSDGSAGGPGGDADGLSVGARGIRGVRGGMANGYCSGTSYAGPGGEGGDAGLTGGVGSAGDDGFTGGSGGLGVTMMYPLRAIAGDGGTGTTATPVGGSGANGAIPANQAQGALFGSEMDDWRALPGAGGIDGGSGKNGSGGGGGGGARHQAIDGTIDAKGRGGGGGGGGGAGCGGQAGGAGIGGGGSIALMAFNSPGLVLTNNTFVTAGGGKGGSGGDGGLGGTFGAGGNGGLGFSSVKEDALGNPLAVGGDGGAGGKGSKGGYAGAGSGGAGGMSVGIFVGGTAPAIGSNTFTLGPAGVGGAGGQYSPTRQWAPSGEAGIQANTFTMSSVTTP